MDILQWKDISFAYPLADGEERRLFSGLNLSVKKGEILALLGPSGCGKTTLTKLGAGFLAPHGGQVLFKGRPVEKPFALGQMIFQESHQLLPWLNLRDNISFPHRKKKADSVRVDSLLKRVGLERWGTSYPGELSGGMKQRGALARALYMEPEILFMDESFVSLDAPSRHGLQDLLLDIWEQRETTIIFVTHDMGEALYLADRILLMSGKKEPPRISHNPLDRPRKRWDRPFLDEVLRLHSLVESSLGIL
ncbi:MAG: ATP-binding cassette domain-containing protein [Spirochaetales bacterium]|nr:ATP-binding cassette domain-containing protein [Spirochaetales bacterium]